MFIESIAIRNFRGILECSISGFTDVNVLIGRNGSGKSTILESIYLASAGINPTDELHGKNKISYVISRRTDRGDWSRSRDVLWFLMDTVKDIDLKFIFTNKNKFGFKLIHFDDKGRVWLSIPKKILSEYPSWKYDYYSYSDNSLLSRKKKSFGFENLRSKFVRWYADTINFLEKVVLIDSRILANPKQVEDVAWSKILAKRLDRLITKMVREGFEADAEDITYMPIGGDKVLALKLSKTTVRVDDLGDGARNAILMASILLTLNNTAVLMEEPETHQHPGGLKTVMDFVLRAAKERKLQLFMSTHSVEFLKIIHKLCDDIGLGLKIFFLERDTDGFVDVRSMEHVDVDTLLKLGLDPRFLDVV